MTPTGKTDASAPPLCSFTNLTLPGNPCNQLLMKNNENDAKSYRVICFWSHKTLAKKRPQDSLRAKLEKKTHGFYLSKFTLVVIRRVITDSFFLVHK